MKPSPIIETMFCSQFLLVCEVLGFPTSYVGTLRNSIYLTDRVLVERLIFCGILHDRGARASRTVFPRHRAYNKPQNTIIATSSLKCSSKLHDKEGIMPYTNRNANGKRRWIFICLVFVGVMCLKVSVQNEKILKSIQKGAIDIETAEELQITIDSTLNPSDVKFKKKILEFERQEGVVVVTKLHGPNLLLLLEQSLCLFHHAYNNRPLYDILVFTTEPISEEEIADTRRLVAPAKLNLILDNSGLQNEIAALTSDRRTKFLSRCNVTSPETLTWWSECPGRLAYNWQAEFRAWHLWKHPALAQYRYMLWLDTDAFSTKVWDRDPVAYMIEQDLVIFFDNFPMGSSKGKEIQERVYATFNTTLCDIVLHKGHLQSKTGPDCFKGIPLVHGFFHITNLDFYRSNIVQNWVRTLIGDCFLCRNLDDQVAVTVPAAILAPERARDMRSSGLKLDIFHNYFMDGRRNESLGGFLNYYKNVVRHNLNSTWQVCPIKGRA